MKNNNLNSSLKLTAILICATIAATGTFPYGYNFSHNFSDYVPVLVEVLIGILCASAATLGNIGLGVYSLLRIKIKPPIFSRYFLIIFGALSAVPTGFLFYFAYQGKLPVILCVLGSVVVFIINIGINYVAMVNLLIEATDKKLSKLKLGEKLVRIVGLIIGIVVSLTFFLATSSGVIGLLEKSHMSEETIYCLACLAAFISWLPVAALFSYSTQSIGSEIYRLSGNFTKHIKEINLSYAIIILIALGAGSSYSEMAIRFFSLEKNIPYIFKAVFSPIYMGGLAYISACTVDYFALKNIFLMIKRHYAK